MSDTDTAGDAGDPKDASEASAKTFTQADLEHQIGLRLARERAKYADYDELRAKAERLDEIEAANQSELEKAQQRAEQAEQALEQIKVEMRSTRLRAAIEGAARDLGAVDASDVFALVDKDQVTVGDDGQVTGAVEAVKALLEAKPHLVGNQTAPAPAPGSADGGPRGSSDRDRPRQLTRADLSSMSPEQIVAAEEAGQLDDLMGRS